MAQPLHVHSGSDCYLPFTIEPPSLPSKVSKATREQFLTRWLPYFSGIGIQRAALLSNAGVTDWTQLYDALWLLPSYLRPSVRLQLDRAIEALSRTDAAYFLSRLPTSEHWRVAAAFPNQTIFLDIETTGLSRYYHQLTLIGWAIAGRFDVVVGDDRSGAFDRLVHDLGKAAVLVTFNGAHFDVPFLRAQVPEVPIPKAHVDLRHLSRRAGASGGQKRIETDFGISRDISLQSITSADAPVLWFKYQRGDILALDLLIRYNHADVEGLRLLLTAIALRTEPDLPTGWKPSPLQLASKEGPLSQNSRLTIKLSPYAGKLGPRLTLRDLPSANNLTVVGIDLSGSPRSITGWASLHGQDASTKALRDDDDIIDATINAHPDLVSIDAPLSLPTGRTRVTDDDPARDRYGITRECERILRRRGVNVYPCLIQSMQSLTARGIELAKVLRSKGIPVIESFPGAMQDILGMPRKRTSLDLLRLAVSEYGIARAFLDSHTTHDEVDALCSAIVGQMFWDGYYEAIGNESEDFLIVPSTNLSDSLPRLAIGLSGYTGSGKTTVARLLRARGFNEVSFSGVLSSLFPSSDGKPLRRPALQRLGEKVHEDPGQRWLEQQVLHQASNYEFVVIDGLRFPEDHAFLVERLGPRFLHVHISAPTHTRQKRFINRGGTQEGYEAAMISPTEAHMQTMRRLARYQVENSGNIDSVQQWLNTQLALGMLGAQISASNDHHRSAIR